MDSKRRFDSRRRAGSVRTAPDLHGERILEGNSAFKTTQMDIIERPSPRTRELHMARRDIGRLNDSRRAAESAKARAESELSRAKKTVKDLTSMIEETNSKAKVQMQELEKLKRPERGGKESGLGAGDSENSQYMVVARELEQVKQELSKLKIDVASVLEERNRAEKEIKSASSKMISCSSSAEMLRKEIDEVNEEQVLVELARIEAVKELAIVEAERREEAKQFSSAMEDTKKKINELLQEIDRSKVLERKLAITTDDANILENELKQLKEMEKRVQSTEISFDKEKEMDSMLELKSVREELEAAKKKLASIKEEGIQFMSSMDVVRDELRHVLKETARLKKEDEKADMTVQTLNSKLLRAKAKLEAVTAAEEKAKTIISNLVLTLEQLKTETEAAKKERELICEETKIIKQEVQKTESDIDLAEERLEAAMLELEAVKSSEAAALENLKALIEKTVTTRASTSHQNSTIQISNFEYAYLKQRAVGAEDIADKKVAAAQAWIEALKASEKEILMKTELTQRKIRELRLEEEQETFKTEKSPSAKQVVGGGLQNWREKRERNSESGNPRLKGTLSRKSIKENGSSTPVGRAKVRKSTSPAVWNLSRNSSMGSVAVGRRKKKVMPNLAKFFNSKSIEQDT
ncbi:hypothetical protein NMG60_11006158 [Bertholletia excelsa]